MSYQKKFPTNALLETRINDGTQYMRNPIKTPLVIYVPGLIPKKFTTVSQNLNLFSTITGAVGAPTPDGIQGHCLLRCSAGVVSKNVRFAVSQAGPNKFSIFDDSWKLIVNNRLDPLIGAELCLLPVDLGETNNVILQNAPVAQSLLAELKNILWEKPTHRRVAVSSS